MKSHQLWQKDRKGKHKLVVSKDRHIFIMASTHNDTGHHRYFAIHTHIMLWYLVFGSPVRSGLLTPRAIDCNRNWSFHFRILKKTGPNRCGPVHIGFLRLRNWLGP